MTGSLGLKKPFYFAEDEETHHDHMGRRLSSIDQSSTLSTSATVSKVSSRSSETTNLEDILLFPVENSHAYSYAHLSPNSLALRLNVLKRSLEILNERPDWLKFLRSKDEPNNSDEDTSAPPSPIVPSHTQGNKSRMAQIARPPMFKLQLRTEVSSSSSKDRFKLSSTASSAALSALFRPKLGRAESAVRSRTQSETSSLSGETRLERPFIRKDEDETVDTDFTDDLKDIIELIEQDASLLSSKSEIAATLHDLSLSSGSLDSKKKQNILKTKLLFALASPFVETASMATPLWGAPMPTSACASETSAASHSSMTALNMLASQSISSNSVQLVPPGNRPFHSISAGKHSSPQSIITVEAEFPWGFKAANDLACLMFGVLKSMIKNVTLIDLIAPQFRNFVTERMTKVIGNLDRHQRQKKQIIFAGEIIAITRHSEGDFAWTSIWAQKKGDMIICMFEQISCDAFDILILCDVELYTQQPYTVTALDVVAGSLIKRSDTNGIKDLRTISDSLDKDLKMLAVKHGDDSNYDWEDSKMLNRRRYYTLQLNGEDNIPCALTSYPMEKDDSKFELKLKVHSMPYIAGMFVVDSSDLKVLSCNKAIAKNLFGIAYDDVLEHSIDRVIPDFSKILQNGLEDQDSSFQIVPGLVLPEHFFRKYDAILRLRLSPNKSAEQAFLNSRGIQGLHRDGKIMFVDIQLRVVRKDVFVLWVTYSRHSNKSIHKQLQKLSVGGLDEAPLPLRQKGGTSRVDLPSQMKLFPEIEADILELGSSSSDVSRHSSTRRPKRATTFAVPVTYISDATLKRDLNSEKYGSLRSVSISEGTLAASDIGKASTRPSSIETSASENEKEHFYTNYTEAEILAIENQELEERKSKSKFWPSQIGERKRTKKYSEFNILKKMGEGAYGKVVLAEHKDDPAYRIIIKCIDKQRILVDTWVRDRQLGTIPSEIQVMATLNHDPHPNIMRIIDYFEDPDYYYLETPVFGNPPAIDLFDYIEVKSDMSELQCQLIFKQVVSAIYYLHKQGIIHRDIKDENIIVNEVGVVKLIDFGSAGYVKLGPFDVFVGTVDYASPEVLRGEKYDGKPQDIWALGILLYIMLYKENPFYNVDDIMEGELRVPFIVSESLMDLIERILVRDIKMRPTITDIAEHEWLNV